MIPLIDADVLRYEVGAICEREEGDPSSWDYCEEVLRRKIEQICVAAGGTRPPILFLTGKENFRNDVAVSKPYKGKRKPDKPYHWQNITVFMFNQYDTRLVEGLEADDLMAIEQCSAAKWYKEEYQTVICTRDKDLRMVPGWHYGWECGAQREYGPLLVDDKGAIELIEHTTPSGKVVKKLKGTGMWFFYSQLLTGDGVDNIPGLPRCGPVKAYSILMDSDGTDTWEIVKQVYEEGGYDEAYLYEQVDLLWMVRELHEDGSPVLWRPNS
jgi:hypothetical protein